MQQPHKASYMTTPLPFLPPVQGRTPFSLDDTNLSVVMFTQGLTPEQQAALHDTTTGLYFETSGGPTRPMIVVECTRPHVACFRKVSGRELPTKELFDQLLTRLTDELGFVDVPPNDHLAGLPPAPTPIPAPVVYDHTRSSGPVPRSKWSRSHP